MTDKLILTEVQLENFKKLINHYAATFPRSDLRKRMETIDRAYNMELRREVKEEAQVAKADDVEHSDRFENIDLPIVRKQVSSEIPFMENIFLSDDPIFAVEKTELTGEDESAVIGINTKIKEDSQVAGWRFELTKFLLCAVKYNLAAAEISWDIKKIRKRRRSANSTDLEKASVEWQGNKITGLDPYNIFFDTSVAPWDVASKGEFAGYVERLSHTRLAETLASLIELQGTSSVPIYLNYPEEMWSKTVGTSNAGDLTFYQPDFLTQQDLQVGTDWQKEFMLAAGIEPSRSGKGVTGTYYDVSTFYIKFIPYAMGLKVSGDEADNFVPQIWKITVVGGEHILAVIPVDNSHSLLPIVVTSPDIDNLGLQAKSSIGCIVGMQKLACEFMARRVAGIDRGIGDRAVVDPEYFAADAFSKRIPDQKIFVNSKFSRSNKSLAEVYRDIPYRDNTASLLQLEIPFLLNLSEETNLSNATRNGQFQKGNKTPDEVRQTLANSEAPLLRRAQQLELQAFYRIKFMLQYNYVDYAQLQEYGTGENKVRFDPQTLLSTALKFRLAGGLDPLSIAMRQGQLSQIFEMGMTVPIINQRYDLLKIFEDTYYATGLQLDRYRVPLDRQAAEAGAGNVTPAAPAPATRTPGA